MWSVLAWEEFQLSVPPSGQGPLLLNCIHYSLCDDYHSSCDVCATCRPKKRAIIAVSH